MYLLLKIYVYYVRDNSRTRASFEVNVFRTGRLYVNGKFKSPQSLNLHVIRNLPKTIKSEHAPTTICGLRYGLILVGKQRFLDLPESYRKHSRMNGIAQAIHMLSQFIIMLERQNQFVGHVSTLPIFVTKPLFSIRQPMSIFC